MENKFFGSKLNTVLLVILIILLGVTIWMIKENKIIVPINVPVQEVQNTQPEIKDNEVSGTNLKEYKNEQLGISFLIPQHCGEPKINEYYKYIDQNKIIQAIFNDDCPLHVLSAVTTDVIFDGSGDTSFSHYKSKIKDNEFNTQNDKGLKGIIEYPYFFSLVDSIENVTFRFNLKSSKFLVVNLSGKTNESFRNIINSIEIK
jgi:hypothetical protein